MRVTPEAVRLARMANVSPVRLQRNLDVIDRWLEQAPQRLADLEKEWDNQRERHEG